ncbi:MULTISPECIES: hypothetical protein [Kitasatospora]|uniref:hypothetical protein n=1 Tax=Kitasatospora TaxID=2063 RepID=UPI0012FF5393|nr:MULTISPECIES: hypothetical protein [Kitasatospora]
MDGEAEIRALIGSWLAAEDGVPDGPCAAPDADGKALATAGSGVPESAAREVAAVARRLALGGPDEGGAGELLEASAGLRGVARALVVDEHPSAGRWTRAERDEVARWVALLMHRFGEGGVQLLLAELSLR